MVIGDGRKFLTALIVPRRAVVEEFAEEHGLHADYDDLLRQPEINHVIADEVEQLCATFAPYERVKAFALVPKDFTAEDGLMTPTLKLRRKAIEAHYRELVDSLYQTKELLSQ